jgi:hypothetical protein
MDHKVQLKENLIKTQRHATDIVINHFSEKLVYHDIEYMHRLIQYMGHSFITFLEIEPSLESILMK